MDKNSNTSLILHVKGTEQETTTLPKKAVREALSQGQLTHSQLIWSPPDNAWKQVRELPHLLPSQKLAPAPVPRAATGALPRISTGPIPKVAGASPTAQTGSVPRVAKQTGAVPRVASPTTQTGGIPRVAASVQSAVNTEAVPRVTVASTEPKKDYKLKDEGGSHPLKWISIGMGVLLLGVMGLNYLLVSHPLSSEMSKTQFSSVTAYAHLGAFVQTNVIVIHVPTTKKLTKENLTDFLVALAQSTPSMPLSENAYGRVALTSGWTASYTLPGGSWKQLGEMGKDDEAMRKEFILDSIGGPAGEPLIEHAAGRDEATLQAEREKVWNTFAAQFIEP